ncbi:kinase-like domain-containing protein [Pisolithus sp. B1]|nr:kinase-like domain-containing protein [Pisolithus sp. B1]
MLAVLTSPQHAFNEIQIWTRLEHENIMPLLGITTKFDKTISMVSEWMERGNAHNYVQDVAVDPRPLLLGVARGLSYLHSSDIVHGDLKGMNVLISGAGRALITDFGSSHLSNPLPNMDVDPLRVCSLRWLAPECLDTNIASQQADIWAFGMTVLELFSRTNPFHKARTEQGIIACILRGFPSRPSNESTNFRLCNKWWTVCMGCWRSEPSMRPTMNDIITEIE